MSKGLSLDKFAKGAMRERFICEIQRVAANIWDPNTSAKAKRTITIKLVIVPDEDRAIGDVEIFSNSTLCPVKSVKTRVLLGYDEKTQKGVCSELNTEIAGQMALDEEDASLGEEIDQINNEPNITNIKRWGTN